MNINLKSYFKNQLNLAFKPVDLLSKVLDIGLASMKMILLGTLSSTSDTKVCKYMMPFCTANIVSERLNLIDFVMSFARIVICFIFKTPLF